MPSEQFLNENRRGRSSEWERESKRCYTNCLNSIKNVNIFDRQHLWAVFDTGKQTQQISNLSLSGLKATTAEATEEKGAWDKRRGKNDLLICDMIKLSKRSQWQTSPGKRTKQSSSCLDRHSSNRMQSSSRRRRAEWTSHLPQRPLSLCLCSALLDLWMHCGKKQHFLCFVPCSPLLNGSSG